MTTEKSWSSQNFYFGSFVLSHLSSTKLSLRFLLICFAWEIKGFYQSSLGNEVDVRDIMNVPPNILAKNWYFKKLRQFRRWKTTDNNDINIFLSLGNPCTFLLAKENTWKCILNTNRELSQNHIEKQIMPSKNNKLAI